MTDATRRLCGMLGDLLSYPRGEVAPLARAARALAGPCAAGSALGRFAAAAEAAEPAALEELYTATFDLDPACAPYIGVQLLGDEDPMRGPLLAKLAEIYAAEGHATRGELPDHVAEVMGFLAVARSGPARDDLVADGLLPALERMLESLGARPNPYRELLVAVRDVLGPAPAASAWSADARVRAGAEVDP
jgi:nitrate reductase delta subunit